MKKLLPQLADLPAEAETRQRTIQELQRELATTKGQLTIARRGAPTAAPVIKEKVVEKRVEVPVLKDGQVKRLETAIKGLATIGERQSAAGVQLITVATDLVQALGKFSGNGHRPAPVRLAPTTGGLRTVPPARPLPQPRAEIRKAASPAHSGNLSTSQQRILNALAWLETIGKATADKTMLALMADASPTSGGYFNNLGVLRTAGLITYPSAGAVALTEAGREAAFPVDVPTTSQELHTMLFAKLSSSQQKVLAQLIELYPDPISKDDLAAAADQSPTSGGYFNNLGRLRSLGLIDYPVPGQVVALPVLFLET